jgi:hypothetical protein
MHPHLLPNKVRIAGAQDFSGSALERLDLPKCRLRLPSFPVQGCQFGRRTGSWVQQVGQQPHHFAAVDAVLDHPHQHPAGVRALLSGQVHPRQVGAVSQMLDGPVRHR